MKKVEITMEKTIRVTRVFDVTDTEYDDIIDSGKNPRMDQMMEEITKQEERYLHAEIIDADIEYDYCIEDPISKKCLVDWD